MKTTVKEAIVTTYEFEDERSYQLPLKYEDQELYLQYFHGVFMELFDKIINERKS